MVDYFSNQNIEEFDRYVEFLGFNYGDKISISSNVYINVEDYIFPNKETNFSNHVLTLQELSHRFNKMLGEFADYESKYEAKQYRLLSVALADVKSNNDEDIFKWSYYNHKFAASQGQDTEAMKEWHRLDSKLDINKITRFKARRETNMAFYMHVLRNAKFFDKIFFSGINPEIKHEVKFGLDIAEEQYLGKLIKENQAQGIASIVDYGCESILLNFMARVLNSKSLKLKGHILSNSRKLNKYLLMNIRSLFHTLEITETNIETADFVFLVNDLDLLSLIPEVDTDKPIFTIDLSEPSTPNFSYLLLKDSGFNQIYGYAKRRENEAPIKAMVRALCCGLMAFIMTQRFNQQIAANYMDDYFQSLSKSLGKSLKDFQVPIDLLAEKLEQKL